VVLTSSTTIRLTCELTTSDGGSFSLKLKSPSVYDEMTPTFIDLAGGVFCGIEGFDHFISDF